MVCVAADSYNIDFLTQGIEQYNDSSAFLSTRLISSRVDSEYLL